jgi:hypothetical protein
MLENPCIPEYSSGTQTSADVCEPGSDNPPDAENQQERLVHNTRILRDYTPNAGELFVGEDIVPSAWRHAGTGVKEALFFLCY